MEQGGSNIRAHEEKSIRTTERVASGETEKERLSGERRGMETQGPPLDSATRVRRSSLARATAVC